MKTETTVIAYDIHDVTEYINWLYFSTRGDFSPGLLP